MLLQTKVSSQSMTLFVCTEQGGHVCRWHSVLCWQDGRHAAQHRQTARRAPRLSHHSLIVHKLLYITPSKNHQHSHRHRRRRLRTAKRSVQRTGRSISSLRSSRSTAISAIFALSRSPVTHDMPRHHNIASTGHRRMLATEFVAQRESPHPRKDAKAWQLLGHHTLCDCAVARGAGAAVI